LPLRLQHRLKSKSADVLSSLLAGLPFRIGSPVTVSIRPRLASHRGKLLSGSAHKGTPVHAASFVRERRIVLESELIGDEQLLRLILTHELLHFVWPRLGNPTRAGFASLVCAELRAGARGELGESAAVGKERLGPLATSERNLRRWRHYLCEAFCDTGAFLYAGVRAGEHFTLAPRWIARRKAWFGSAIDWNLRCF
jgi:hypothetical protein